ncbi:AMP-binding protein [Halobacteriovorax sp. HLS]|uniref:AMP-binding protein n=1 Tax=Halobacteriovorax sp. HLS TaxID=2234000 RepID=UPI000FDAA83C|nr:AMP-binding protein [Halobacteriovorax sp. HLS]
MKFITFHGSPGGPADFKQLESYIDGEFIHIDRYNQSPQPKIVDEKLILLAYSWGSKELFDFYQRNSEQVEKIILISPFLFNSNVSTLKNLLLATPILGSALLKRIGPKAIEKFIKDSTSPLEVPKDYQAQSDYLSDYKILKKSIFEKVHLIESEFSSEYNIECPVLIIYGSEDKTSDYNEQVSPLERNIKTLKVETIAGAGHALTWTNAHEVSKLINEYIGKSTESTMTKKLGYYDGCHAGNNVYSFIVDHLEKFPTRPILKWVDRETIGSWSFKVEDQLEHKSVSVAELYHFSNKIAKGFSDLGIQKGDRVILFVPMSLYLYASMFALQKIGAIPTFLDSWARRDQLGVSAEVADPKCMISFQQAFDLCSGADIFDNMPLKIVVGEHTGSFDSSIEKLMQSEGEVPICPMEQEETALITFTTGSSGTPKGANRTHRFLAAQHYALHRGLPYVDSDVDLPVFPIFSLNNLAEGVATVIPSFDVGAPTKETPIILLAQFKACNVTCTTLSPSIFNSLSKHCLDNGITMPELKRVVTGGAPVSRDNIVDFTKVAPNAEILVLYGSTEVEPIAHISAKEMIEIKSVTEDDPELVDEGVNVGHLDGGLQYKFIKISKGTVSVNSDSDFESITLKDGEVGELIVSGEHVCRDYYNNEEAFSRAKILDHNGIVWHRTGDLGKLDDQKNLWLVGRVHNAIIRSEQYLFPVRAEIVLKKLPFTKYCAYLGVEDQELGEKTVCVVAPREENSLTDSQMISEIERIMKKNSIIVDKVIIFSDIPMDARHHSKVEYDILRKDLKSKGLI